MQAGEGELGLFVFFFVSGTRWNSCREKRERNTFPGRGLEMRWYFIGFYRDFNRGDFIDSLK